MFYKKNIDFVELIWEDFMFQIDNKETTTKRRENMPYPIFTKAIIQYYISKDKSISMRNRMFMHLIKNDSILGTLKFVPKGKDNQYGKTVPAKSIIRTKKSTGKRKPIGIVIKDTPIMSKQKTSVQAQKHKGMEMLSEAASFEEAQTRKSIKISKRETSLRHQIGGSSERTGSKPKVLDEPKGNSVDTSKGAGLKPEVPDVSKVMSSAQESENKSWGESEDDNDDLKSKDERTESGTDRSIDLQNTYDEEEIQDDEWEMCDDVNVRKKYTKLDDEDKGNEEMTDVAQVNVEKIQEEVDAEHVEVNQEVASAKIQDEAQATTIAAPATQKEKTDAPPSSSSQSVSSNYEFIKEHSVPVDVVEVLKQQRKPQKSAADIRKIKMGHAPKQQEPQYTIKSSDKDGLNEFDQKQALFETMTASKSFNNHPKHMALYHALMESILVDEDAMDQGVADK
ncbi:hypothetical protein Tco_1525564 [Tanacetum coccineum]